MLTCERSCGPRQGTMEETDYLERALRMADGGADLFLVDSANQAPKTLNQAPQAHS